MKILQIMMVSVFSFNASAQWLLSNGGTNANLNKVFVIDSLQAYVVGEQSTILKTSDAGNTWNNIIAPVIDNFKSIHFITQYHGIIVGRQTLIETTDGGNNWEEIPDSTQYENMCGFVYGPYIMIGEYGGLFKRTTDGGRTWSISNFNPSPILSIVFKKGNSIGYFMCPGSIYKSTNFGLTWTPEIVNFFFPYNMKISKDDSTVFAAGIRGDYPTFPFIVFNNSTTNQWIFKDYYTLEDKTFLDIAPLTSYNFYLCSRFGYLAKTIDGGDSLQVQAVPTSQNLNSIDFYNSEIGYAVGNNGTILVTHNGGVTSINQLAAVSFDFLLSQNYPNPFNPSTRIQYQVASGSYVTLKVYDVLGNEVATLVDEFKPAGSYEVEFSTSSGIRSASGVYFYKLKIGEFVQTKKMILLR